MNPLHKKGSIFSGTLIIAGTSIGGSMLALPVLTGLGGFLPSLIIYLICWLLMALTGLLFLEICLWMEDGANITTMTRNILGKKAIPLTTSLYFFLFYSLSLAYIIGGGKFIGNLLGMQSYPWMGSLLYVLIFAPFVYAGTRYVNRINTPLILGLILSFLVLIVLGYSRVDITMLQHKNWTASLMAIPVSFGAFAYQGTIPSLVHYMQRDVKKIRIAILLGSFIPFLVYTIWEGFILGIVPLYGPKGLLEALAQGQPVTNALQYHLNENNILLASYFFSFFAITTSFLGVTLGLKDFVADAIKCREKETPNFMVPAIVFLPPLIISFFSPNFFIKAFNLAGGIGCASLLGLLPVVMAWKGRQNRDLDFSNYRLFGEKRLLVILLIFMILEITFEISQEIGWSLIPSNYEILGK